MIDRPFTARAGIDPRSLSAAKIRTDLAEFAAKALDTSYRGSPDGAQKGDPSLPSPFKLLKLVPPDPSEPKD
jgi:hypothetical protein